MKNIFYNLALYASVCYDEFSNTVFCSPSAFSAHWFAFMVTQGVKF